MINEQRVIKCGKFLGGSYIGEVIKLDGKYHGYIVGDHSNGTDSKYNLAQNPITEEFDTYEQAKSFVLNNWDNLFEIK